MDKDIPGLDCGEEAIPFYEERGVHIIPIYALTFIVDLPMRPPGQTFSNWDIREKIKTFTHPHELKDLKIVESSDEHIKFTTHVVNIDIMDEVRKFYGGCEKGKCFVNLKVGDLFYV